MPRRVAIVPHTHWDREWYAPFQTFRLRLVDMLDEFLPMLEADLSYARFLLDGQMAVIDDYLDVRPEAAATLRRLASSGRLSMGPWYTLPDEFLVSGETLVRNLQIGMERATAFGGAMPVGYLPDMFGHVAQMPQILRQCGFEHAVVWRGVPEAVDKTAFWWSAPDGSTVRAEYLRAGYGNGAAIPDDAKALVRRISTHEAELGDALLGPMLLMNGTDHQRPQAWLGQVVAEANDIQDDFALEITSLADYLATAPTEGLPAWRGELRSGARANLLMGVASNRLDVKQAAARAERELERRAEPLCALFLPPDRWPARLLEMAWVEMLRNAAHDSVCACSADEVVDAVLVRYAEARQIAAGLADRTLEALAGSLEAEATVIVNPSARTRSGLVELTIPGEGPAEGAQLVRDRTRLFEGEVHVKGSDLGGLLGQIRSQQIDEHTYVNRIDVEDTETGIEIVIHADSRMRESLLVEDVKRDLYARVGERPEIDVCIRIVQPPSRRILTWVDSVPGYGWTPWVPEVPAVTPVTVEGTTMGNGLVHVEVDLGDGTFAVDGHAGLDRLVDGGDHGDTYSYSPPEHDLVVERPERVEVSALEAGPMRARLQVRRTFRWPDRIDNRQRARTGERDVVVTTVLELRAGERAVRVETTFDNHCRDHRLRAHFPLPHPASSSLAECAFAVVERGLEAEGGATEYGLPTFPSRRFVTAGGLTIVHEGLLEYELVESGRTLALTLLRATGMLSRVEVAYRPLPAGPPIRLEGPQMLGRVAARYAVHVDPTGEDPTDPYALVDDVFLPLEVVHGGGGGHRPLTGQALAVDGAEVSAVVRRGDSLDVRVFNPTSEPVTVHMGGRSGWLVDLRGRPLAPFDGAFPLDPWAVATARLRP